MNSEEQAKLCKRNDKFHIPIVRRKLLEWAVIFSPHLSPSVANRSPFAATFKVSEYPGLSSRCVHNCGSSAQ